MKKRIGFIGLGAMGRPMATRLVQTGYEVMTYAHHNHTVVDELVRQGAQRADNAAEVAKQVDVVITMLPDSPDVEAVCFGPNGVASGKAREQKLTIIELMRKDIGLALEVGRELDVPLPTARLAYQLFTQAKGLGYGRQDMTAVSKLYQQAANINIVTGQPFQAEIRSN